MNIIKTTESHDKLEIKTDSDQAPKLDSPLQKMLSPSQTNPKRNINSRNKKETERLSGIYLSFFIFSRQTNPSKIAKAFNSRL